MSRPTLRIEAGNAAVGVADGRIVPAEGRFDLELVIPDAELRPGLINAHDHLHRNHYGRLGAPPYANAYVWGNDIQKRFADAIAAGRAVPRREALLRGAWKNLLAGVTTVVHHDRWETDFESSFPLRVAKVPSAHSLGFGWAEVQGLPTVPGSRFCVHLAEGADVEAAAEIRELDRLGLVHSGLLAVHVVGADEDGVRRLRAAKAAVIWCPSSNLYLFGRTAPPELLAPGIDVLLGSDSLLSADGDLLAELRVAREQGRMSDERLRDAVGAVAARRLGLEPPDLAEGSRADLVVMRKSVLEASAADVALVVADGVIRVLDPKLVRALGGLAQAGETIGAGDLRRWIFAG